MAQVPLAGRGVVGGVGRVKAGAALFEAAGLHHLGKLRLDLVGRDGQRARWRAGHGLHPAIGGQVVFGVAHREGRLAQRGAVAGGHAVQVGFRKVVRHACVVQVAAGAEDLDAIRQRAGQRGMRRGGSGLCGGHGRYCRAPSPCALNRALHRFTANKKAPRARGGRGQKAGCKGEALRGLAQSSCSWPWRSAICCLRHSLSICRTRDSVRPVASAACR